MTDGPVFHVEPQGELGNRMIQYMAALKFRHLLPGTQISNVSLPEWGIHHPPIESPGPVETIGTVHHIDLSSLAARARAGHIRRIECAAWGQRLENFLGPEHYRSVFRSPAPGSPSFDHRYLVCPIRGGDNLIGSWFYPLTPVEFYADIVAQTGLTPVFLGQIESNLYTDRLRARFPSGVFLEPRPRLDDFEQIRGAKNIVVGVSTFHWLAAWLSHADRIFLAVNGLFNPMQYPAAFMVPLDDPRYKFYLFPLNFGVPLEHHAAAHRRIAPYWRQMPAAALRRLWLEAPRFEPSPESMHDALDCEFYLASNPDVAAGVGRDNADGARLHYRQHGYHQSRAPFRLDPTWYTLRYPTAALEMAQGDYPSLLHHFAAVGRQRGYQPVPDTSQNGWWEDI